MALLHTLFFHPSFTLDDSSNKKRAIHTVILVVPVNTIVNWENEFEKWTHKMGTIIRVHNLAESTNRVHAIEKWSKQGGVLLMSDALFRNVVKKNLCENHLRAPGPDVIIIDEAHIMLKNKSNEVFKALNGVRTRRRICLTGSPFQNNLFEFFRMASYICPGVLGHSERKFEKDYVLPILCGMSSDSTAADKEMADEKMQEIKEKLRPYVQRKDASVLLEDLPPMQQVVLHVRQTKVQSRLYGAYKKYARSGVEDAKNFLRMYSNLRPIHNHPGCLLLREPKAGKEDRKSPVTLNSCDNERIELKKKDSTSPNETCGKESPTEKDQEADVKVKIEPNIKCENDATQKQEFKWIKSYPSDGEIIDLISDSEDEIHDSSVSEDLPEEWWSKAAEKSGDKMGEIGSGNKIVLLLHILTHADQLKEKVVLFSQCLKVRSMTS